MQPNGTLCAPAFVSTPQANAFALYNQLPQGAFTAEQLLAAGDVPTALSFATGNDTYNLHFYRGRGGEVCINTSAPTNNPCITKSYFGCDGIMHVTGVFLLPSVGSTLAADVPGTLKTMYDFSSAELEPFQVNTTCSDSLIQALNRAPDAAWWASIPAAVTTPDLESAFQSSNTSITLFAESDAAYYNFLSNNSGEWGSAGATLMPCMSGSDSRRLRPPPPAPCSFSGLLAVFEAEAGDLDPVAAPAILP
jgi:hypothetical protein